MCVFLGYPPGMKGYKMYDIQNSEIFVSRDIVFHEDTFLFHDLVSSDPLVDPFPDLMLPKPAAERVPVLDESVLNSQNVEDSIPYDPSPMQSMLPVRTSSRMSQPSSYLRDYHCNLLMLNPQPTARALYPLSDYISYDSLSQKHKAFALMISAQFEPKSYHEAIKHHNEGMQ